MVKKFKDFINYDKRIGKMIICGDEGSGKTLLLTAILVGKMLHGLEDCWKSYEVVDEYNSLGMNLSKNYDHLAFSNFPVNCKETNIPMRKVYRCNPYRLGLFDKLFPTDFFPPYTLFGITEGYNVFNSYLFNKFRDGFKGFIKTSRHGKYDMVIDTHTFGDICTLFKKICNRFIYLQNEVEHIKDKEGNVCGHRFSVIEWKHLRDVEVFERTTKKQNCEEYTLEVDKCYFENYDTEYCKYLHLIGRKHQDFLVENFSDFSSVEEFEDLLEEFGMVAPDGFFLGKGNKKVVEEIEEDDEDVSF